jgi:hypothetical protein
VKVLHNSEEKRNLFFPSLDDQTHVMQVEEIRRGQLQWLFHNPGVFFYPGNQKERKCKHYFCYKIETSRFFLRP